MRRFYAVLVALGMASAAQAAPVTLVLPNGYNPSKPGDTAKVTIAIDESVTSGSDVGILYADVATVNDGTDTYTTFVAFDDPAVALADTAVAGISVDFGYIAPREEDQPFSLTDPSTVHNWTEVLYNGPSLYGHTLAAVLDHLSQNGDGQYVLDLTQVSGTPATTFGGISYVTPVATAATSSVPEPAPLLVLGAGVGGLLLGRTRRRA